MDNIPAQSFSSVSSVGANSSFRQQVDELGDKRTGLTSKNFVQKQKTGKVENQQPGMKLRLRAQERFTGKGCVVICSSHSDPTDGRHVLGNISKFLIIISELI